MDEFENSPTIEGLQAAFGIVNESAPVEETTAPETPTEADVPENEATETTEAEAEAPKEGTQPQQPQTAQNKQQGAAQQFQQNRQQQANQAFAKMRTENAAMLKSLQTTAQILGIDPKLPPDQLSAAIQKQANIAIAKSNNMDPAILNRLNELEGINARYQQQEQEKQIMTSLEYIRNTFQATDDDLTVFVQTLDQEGFDPFKPGAPDLVTEFIKRNFTAIQKKAVDNAVRAEQARASKAGGASKPSGKQGQEETTEDKKIESQLDFDEFMNSLIN